MDLMTLLAGLLIFAIGFGLGFFVCILGLIMERAREADEKNKNTTQKKEEDKP